MHDWELECSLKGPTIGRHNCLLKDLFLGAKIICLYIHYWLPNIPSKSLTIGQHNLSVESITIGLWS